MTDQQQPTWEEFPAGTPILQQILPALVQHWMMAVVLNGAVKIEKLNINGSDETPTLFLKFNFQGQPFEIKLARGLKRY